MPQLHPKSHFGGSSFSIAHCGGGSADRYIIKCLKTASDLSGSERMDRSQSESLKAHRAALVTVLEVHLSDRLGLLLQRQASPLRTAVDKKKTQSDPLGSNYYTQMNPTAFPSCSGEVWARLWQ